ncbi:hypothetical protein DSECCO2_304010 [anaerobic digester metagenome]
MGEEESFPVPFPDNRFALQTDPKFFFKIIKSPDIMISPEEVYGNSLVCNISNFAKQAGKPFRNNRVIFELEIENIPHQQNFRGILPDQFQPLHQQLSAYHA